MNRHESRQRPIDPVPQGSVPPPRPERTIPRVALHKIQDTHRQRLAVVYVRQSTPQQVVENRESRARQYALAQHAATLGWAADRVLVIDEDQGRSGKTAEGRTGFQHLLAEVTMGHVGVVLGLEMSRLARSSQDWHRLFEVCGFLGTLLADEEGVYDANDPNDRLLLGLKGILSEMELFTMRARLHRGSLHKAQRGELFLHLPIGYVKLPSGAIAFDPDEQVRAVVQLVFDKFDELGTATAVFRYLARHNIRLGIRPNWGPSRGQVEWRRPCRTTVLNLLRNPMYAGVYAYGRRHDDPQKRAQGRGRSTSPSRNMDEWPVLLRDKLPAYITWERFLANQERLHQNRARWDARGASRQGPALLGGLIHCGQCGGRLTIHYGSHNGRGYYTCHRQSYDPEAPRCPSVPSKLVDGLVAEQLMLALEPASLELSVQASQDVQRERDRLHGLWKQRLERAHYETERARRQYNAVDPENRLVARTLERAWEEALQQERQLQEEYDRFLRDSPPQVSAAERERIAALAADIPALWQAPTTTAADRKEIVRHVVQRVEATVPNGKDFVAMAIHWMGGHVSHHEVSRQVFRFEQLTRYAELRQRVIELREAGWTATRIAAQVNQEGFRPPRNRATFNAANVNALLKRLGQSGLRDQHQTDKAKRKPHEWCLPELARKLRVPIHTMRRWRQRGWVHSRRVPGCPNRWFVWADPEELRRLRRLRDCPMAPSNLPGGRYPKELTTPKRRSAL
jgi:DNA invertase Pin-like site-specific DNA recombinase